MENINVIVFQEEGAWLAHCVEVDICTQAADLKTLQRRLDLTIQLELEESIRRHGEAFAGIGPAPTYIREKWEMNQKSFKSSGEAHVTNGIKMSVGYERALCA